MFTAGGWPPRRFPGLEGGGPRDWRALRGGTLGVGSLMTCGMDGPARGTGGLAGRGMDDAAGMEGVSSLTGTGVLGVLMVCGSADCAGTDERRVGMRDVRGARLRRGRVEMDSPGAVVGTAGVDVMDC